MSMVRNRNKEPRVEPVSVGPDRAALILGLARTRIYELMREGRLRSFKEGRRRLLRVEELRRFAADQERVGGAA